MVIQRTFASAYEPWHCDPERAPCVENEQVHVASWPGYFDGKHRYISTLEYLYTGTNPSVTVADLMNNSIQSYTTIGVSGTPALLA